MDKQNDQQKMLAPTNWFSLQVLWQSSARVLFSSLILKYSDVRFSMPGLDPLGPKGHGGDEDESNGSDELWLDYAADTGDGWNPSYTIACGLAQDLRVGEQLLPAAKVLVLGGDEVYPFASKENYDFRFRGPFEAATQGQSPERKLFAIPGNHDWYDGLGSFLKIFAQGRSIGAWQTTQKRSYFAKRLTSKWWVWGIDIQLLGDIDGPQIDYFHQARDLMKDGENLILCTAVPTWAHGTDEQAIDKLDFLIQRCIHRGDHKNSTIRLAAVLSGDLHHYSRYACKPCDLVTAGGGGAFLHATHTLPATSTFLGYPAKLLEGSFPSPQESRHMTRFLWNFPIKNFPFCLMMGFVLGAFGALVNPDTLWFFLAAITVIHANLSRTHAARWLRSLFGLLHGSLHAALVTVLLTHLPPDISGVMMIALRTLILGLLSGTALALYLAISNIFGMHANEAFCAISSPMYKNFLRIHIKGDKATVFALGIKQVPKRWKEGPATAGQPKYVPEQGSMDFSLIDQFQIPHPAVRQQV